MGDKKVRRLLEARFDEIDLWFRHLSAETEDNADAIRALDARAEDIEGNLRVVKGVLLGDIEDVDSVFGERLDGVDGHVEGLDSRLGRAVGRLDVLEDQFDRMQVRLSRLEELMRSGGSDEPPALGS